MTLGELLKTKRTQLGMTLDEVADAAGCSKSHLHGLEGDKCEPGIVLCARLSVALGLPVQAMAAAALTGALKTAASGSGFQSITGTGSTGAKQRVDHE
jgi:transcriptional regulator with XRE-family HTH domain